MRVVDLVVRLTIRILGPAAAIIAIVALASCTSAPRPDPTPEHPRVGCIADSPFPARQKLSLGGSRLLPEIVRIIGSTSLEDGERWMIVRGGAYSAQACADPWDRERCEWLPYDKREIQTGGACGPEADAHRDLMAASPSPVPVP